MKDRRCKWCYRTIAEIIAAIEAQGGKAPLWSRIFDRNDLWAKCILCRTKKRGSLMDAQEGAVQPVYARRRITRKHGTDNRE